MAQTPMHRSSRTTLAIPGNGRTAPGAIDYGTPVDAVGFEQMPQPVIDALSSLLVGPPLAADAEPSVVKRRPDGTYYQQAVGWWAGGDRYLTIDARRLLAPVEGQKLTPATGWKIDGNVRYFAPGATPHHSQWRFDRGTDTRANKKPRARVENPLDVLPEELTRPVRDADASAWLKFDEGWAEETIVTAVPGPDRVKVLRAQRTARSERALDSADWHVVTLDAVITSTRVLATDAQGRVRLGPPSEAPAVLPGATRRQSIAPRT